MDYLDSKNISIFRFLNSFHIKSLLITFNNDH